LAVERVSTALVGLAVGVTALIAGLLAGAAPQAAIALACGAAFLLVAMTHLWVALCGFTFLVFVDVVRFGGNEDLSMAKAAALVLVVAWLAAMTLRRSASGDLVKSHPGLTWLLIAFVCWVGAGAIWADSDSGVVRALLRYAPNIVLVPIVYLAVSERRHLAWLLGAFVVGALASALVGSFVTGGAASISQAAEGRLTGATAEANELAMLLVVAATFAAALAGYLRGRSAAWPLAGLAALLALFAIFSTLSRSGLTALAAALVAGIVVGGPWRRGVALSAALIAAAGCLYFATAGSSALERITSSDSSGRADLWTVGWRAASENPATGIGADNFRSQSVRYLVEPGAIDADQYIVDEPLVVHNVYLELFAELGVIGLALFLAIVGGAIACAARAIGEARQQGDLRMELLARALVVALAAMLTADFFLSEQYSKQLWLLLALGPAALAITRRQASTRVQTLRFEQPAAPARWAPARAVRR
jgi:O-antigen ligase